MTCLVEKSGFRGTAIWRLWAVVLLATFVGVAGFGVALAQDAADQEAATIAPPADAPAVARSQRLSRRRSRRRAGWQSRPLRALHTDHWSGQLFRLDRLDRSPCR